VLLQIATTVSDEIGGISPSCLYWSSFSHHHLLSSGWGSAPFSRFLQPLTREMHVASVASVLGD